MILNYRNEIAKRTKSYERTLAMLGKYDPLTKEEEDRLFILYKNGDNSALEKLVLHNMRLVVLVAKTFQYRESPIEDLISEAYCGLIRAAQTYDYTLGNRFMSYAIHWMRQHVQVYVDSHSNNIRIPGHTRTKINKLTRYQNQRLTAGELPDTDVEFILAKIKPISYNILDAPKPDDTKFEPIDPDAVVDDIGSNNEVLIRCLESMDEPYKTVLIRFFGIYTNKPETLLDIGMEMGKSRERVRQIKDKGLVLLRRKLRRHLNTGELQF